MQGGLAEGLHAARQAARAKPLEAQLLLCAPACVPCHAPPVDVPCSTTRRCTRAAWKSGCASWRWAPGWRSQVLRAAGLWAGLATCTCCRAEPLSRPRMRKRGRGRGCAAHAALSVGLQHTPAAHHKTNPPHTTNKQPLRSTHHRRPNQPLQHTSPAVIHPPSIQRSEQRRPSVPWRLRLRQLRLPGARGGPGAAPPGTPRRLELPGQARASGRPLLRGWQVAGRERAGGQAAGWAGVGVRAAGWAAMLQCNTTTRVPRMGRVLKGPSLPDATAFCSCLHPLPTTSSHARTRRIVAPETN